jgi:hypothetical protein
MTHGAGARRHEDANWQFDRGNVPVCTSITYTDAAVRIGVVNASRMEWAGNSNELVYEPLNRLQSIDGAFRQAADAGTGRAAAHTTVRAIDEAAEARKRAQETPGEAGEDEVADGHRICPHLV